LLLLPPDVVRLLLPLNVLLLLLLSQLSRRSILPLGYRGLRKRTLRWCALRSDAHHWWLNTPHLAHIHHPNRGAWSRRALAHLLNLSCLKRTTGILR
jgi:hypothetical protein